MTSSLQWTCPVCSNVGLKDGGDGFYYCTLCNSQADDIIETGVDDDDLFSKNDGGMYSARNRRHHSSQVTACEPITQVKLTQSQHLDLSENFEAINEDNPRDMEGPTGPSDFGSYPTTLNYEDYYSEIRMRYVMGLQIMIQLQCKALVEKCNLNPLITGLVGPIWLRYLAFTRVMADEWADKVIHESESQIQGDVDKILPRKHEKEPHNIHGKRAVTLWYRSLSSRIPLYYSLAINFLVCHLAREAVLPTDIFKWTLEGKLPYFAAFVEIEKQLGPPSASCPINSIHMFRPHSLISVQKLESLAAIIALDIGLDLPPVNFYDLASRFLNKLSIPVKRILPHAFHLYEWSMLPELYLSANKSRLPTRAYVMSILIVTMRIIFNLNGFGWEKSLASSRSSSSLADENGEGHSHSDDGYENISSSENEHHKKPVDDPDLQLDAVSLLTFLERKYSELRDTHDYSKDLFSYLQYCKQVVFTDSEPSFEDFGEENIIEDLWDFYQNQTSVEAVDEGMRSLKFPKKISKDDMDESILKEKNGVNDSSEDHSSKVEEAIKKLKLDMEENRFCYIPPRKRVKKLEYLSYSRKKKEGGYLFAVHADYYILLRAGARVARVDYRTLHCAVLNFERRLKQLEDRIDYCLNIKNPNFSSHKVQRDANGKADDDDDSLDFL